MRPPQGPKKKLDSASEEEMSVYMDFCWEIGIPKTQEMFAEEVVHFMEFNGIPNNFPNVRPGNNRSN